MGLADGVRTVEVGGGPLLVQDATGRRLLSDTPTWLRASLVNGGVEVKGKRAAGVRLVAVSGSLLRVNNIDYPGIIEIARSGDGLTVINELPLEEYVAGVVKAEAGDQMPLEMLKAQAVVARTYAAYHRRLNAAKPYHIVATTAHQQYAGKVAMGSPIWTALLDTVGQVLFWEGDLFPAFYHTDSGGHTEDPRVVFAAGNMPALKPVRVEFASYSPHHLWALDVPLSHLAAQLRKGGVSVGVVIRLEVLERSESLRVARISVHGTRGSAELRGNDFRRLVGYDTLKSTLFAVAVDGISARFSGRGYGHGVGLDQSTAKTMAELGYTARQILEYYYPGAAFSSLR